MTGKIHTHDEAIEALCGCAATVSVLSYQEAIEGYFKLRGLEIPDTAPVTADTLRETITRWLNADDPTHWGEFEKRLAVAVGMDPFAAEDACMARGGEGEGKQKRTMTLTLTDREIAALEEVMAAKDLSAPAVFRNSFRLYQMVERGGATVTVHEAGPLGLPMDISRHPTTPADPRPDPRDEALREAREALVRARWYVAQDRSRIDEPSGDFWHDADDVLEKTDQALAKIDAVIGGAG